MNSRIEESSTIQVMIRMKPALKSKFDTIKKDLEEDIRIETDVITRLSNAAVVDYLCNDGVITERHLNQKDRSFGLKATDKISDRLEMVEKELDTLKAQHLNLLNAFVEHVPDYADDPQPKE